MFVVPYEWRKAFTQCSQCSSKSFTLDDETNQPKYFKTLPESGEKDYNFRTATLDKVFCSAKCATYFRQDHN